jgi:hypothetical protein
MNYLSPGWQFRQPQTHKEEKKMKKFLTVDELSTELQVPKSWFYSQTRQKGEDQIPHLKCLLNCNLEIF